MNVIISNFPEALVFPAEIAATVKLAAETAGMMYGVSAGE